MTTESFLAYPGETRNWSGAGAGLCQCSPARAGSAVLLRALPAGKRGCSHERTLDRRAGRDTPVQRDPEPAVVQAGDEDAAALADRMGHEGALGPLDLAVSETRKGDDDVDAEGVRFHGGTFGRRFVTARRCVIAHN